MPKKSDKNGKKVNDSKPEDKDNNTTGPSGVHVGEVTTHEEDSTAPSNGSSISAHVSEVTKHKFWPAQSIEELLGAYLINNVILGCTDLSDVSVDTVNSAEIMAGNHIREQQTLFFVDWIRMSFNIWQHTCHTRIICYGMMDYISWTITTIGTNYQMQFTL